ncbi:hypothetical protein L5515_004040 [Caenorhabditis briggsae]|uniref:Uncharacterized protein n=1 Tax=Caenorhabditis briggsae TaxID=6238 RepID=A0AAE9JCE9_CAEBR|nr:hypothetical protein L5515_004040 [Caenorhabditis briggsae]
MSGRTSRGRKRASKPDDMLSREELEGMYPAQTQGTGKDKVTFKRRRRLTPEPENELRRNETKAKPKPDAPNSLIPYGTGSYILSLSEATEKSFDNALISPFTQRDLIMCFIRFPWNAKNESKPLEMNIAISAVYNMDKVAEVLMEKLNIPKDVMKMAVSPASKRSVNGTTTLRELAHKDIYMPHVLLNVSIVETDPAKKKFDEARKRQEEERKQPSPQRSHGNPDDLNGIQAAPETTRAPIGSVIAHRNIEDIDYVNVLTNASPVVRNSGQEVVAPPTIKATIPASIQQNLNGMELNAYHQQSKQVQPPQRPRHEPIQRRNRYQQRQQRELQKALLRCQQGPGQPIRLVLPIPQRQQLPIQQTNQHQQRQQLQPQQVPPQPPQRQDQPIQPIRLVLPNPQRQEQLIHPIQHEDQLQQHQQLQPQPDPRSPPQLHHQPNSVVLPNSQRQQQPIQAIQQEDQHRQQQKLHAQPAPLSPPQRQEQPIRLVLPNSQRQGQQTHQQQQRQQLQPQPAPLHPQQKMKNVPLSKVSSMVSYEDLPPSRIPPHRLILNPTTSRPPHPEQNQGLEKDRFGHLYAEFSVGDKRRILNEYPSGDITDYSKANDDEIHEFFKGFQPTRLLQILNINKAKYLFNMKTIEDQMRKGSSGEEMNKKSNWQVYKDKTDTIDRQIRVIEKALVSTTVDANSVRGAPPQPQLPHQQTGPSIQPILARAPGQSSNLPNDQTAQKQQPITTVDSNLVKVAPSQQHPPLQHVGPNIQPILARTPGKNVSNEQSVQQRQPVTTVDASSARVAPPQQQHPRQQTGSNDQPILARAPDQGTDFLKSQTVQKQQPVTTVDASMVRVAPSQQQLPRQQIGLKISPILARSPGQAYSLPSGRIVQKQQQPVNTVNANLVRVASSQQQPPRQQIGPNVQPIISISPGQLSNLSNGQIVQQRPQQQPIITVDTNLVRVSPSQQQQQPPRQQTGPNVQPILARPPGQSSDLPSGQTVQKQQPITTVNANLVRVASSPQQPPRQQIGPKIQPNIARAPDQGSDLSNRQTVQKQPQPISTANANPVRVASSQQPAHRQQIGPNISPILSRANLSNSQTVQQRQQQPITAVEANSVRVAPSQQQQHRQQIGPNISPIIARLPGQSSSSSNGLTIQQQQQSTPKAPGQYTHPSSAEPIRPHELQQIHRTPGQNVPLPGGLSTQRTLTYQRVPGPVIVSSNGQPIKLPPGLVATNQRIQLPAGAFNRVTTVRNNQRPPPAQPPHRSTLLQDKKSPKFHFIKIIDAQTEMFIREWHFESNPKPAPFNRNNTIKAVHELSSFADEYDYAPTDFLTPYYKTNVYPKPGERMTQKMFYWYETRKRWDAAGVKIPVLNQEDQFKLKSALQDIQPCDVKRVFYRRIIKTIRISRLTDPPVSHPPLFFLFIVIHIPPPPPPYSLIPLVNL